MARRLCTERINGRGCPNDARPRPSKCDRHAREYERERSRRRREATKGIFKKKRWAMTREAVLTRDPICKVCDGWLSTEVDHIKPLSQGGDPWRLEGLQGICTPCHQAKTARENARAAFGRSACRLSAARNW
jgi:5-methylcytosine-specific restriction enzyme A